MKLNHFSYTIHKNKLKWIKDQNVKPKTKQNKTKSTDSNFSDVGHSNVFLDMSL